LAGISVTVIDTQSGSHARNVVTNLETATDAIIVAGGDGTLSDVVTGLMRKYKDNLHSIRQCPIGILPLGNTNTIASVFYGKYKDLTDVHHMIDATMAIIKNNQKLIDAIEIKLLEVCISRSLQIIDILNIYFNPRMIQKILPSPFMPWMA
jgi:acylglycerol kinase